LLEAFGWPLYELDDYEADDIMGTLAVQAAKQDIETLLVTSDLDMLQLVDPHIHVFALKKGLSNIELYSPKSFEAKYGIKAEQFLDLKALKGDSSDNIPGVPGIGEKTAIELLKQYKSLDAVYDNLALIKESVAKKLESGKDLAYLSKKLGAIWTDAPLKLDLQAVDGSKCQPEQIRELLQKLEFRSLVRQLPEVMQVQEHHDVQNIFEHGSTVKNVPVRTEQQLGDIAALKTSRLFVYSRAAGKHGRDPKLLIISDGKTAYTVDLERLPHTKVRDKLGPKLTGQPLVGYDVKSTLKVCQTLGIYPEKVGHDVVVGAFLINSLRREQTLSELASADLGYDGAPLEDIPTEELSERAGEVIAIIKALYEQQSNELKELPKIAKLAEEIEWPVIPVLAAMEYEGIKLDTAYLEEMSGRLSDQISDIEQQIFGYADQEFNISSPGQLADILFNKLNLPKTGIKKGKTGFSTAASELDKLRGVHPVIDLITEYREYTKLKSTYVDALPKQVDAQSRVHTTFNLTTAQTGRLSSTDPNLQNIPVRTEVGREIRTAFVADEGNMLVSADYSQFELRLAAYLGNDEELMDMFNRDIDIHTATAAQVYGREPEDVTKNMRRDAKVINFGILYGMSPHGLAAATGMTFEAARNFIEKYFELRKPLLDYMNSLKEKARKDGYVETLFGRRRPTPDIHSTNFVVRQAAERAAINMPIQGTEADLMKLAMVAIQNKLKGKACKQLLQIHDSILVECPAAEAEETAQMLKDTMESIYKLPVKLTVDTSIGQNWGQL
jgi:DNA polymerase-1